MKNSSPEHDAGAGGSKPEQSEKDSQDLSRPRERVLLEFSKSVRAIGLYPEGHPQLANAMELSFQIIMKSLISIGEAGFDVTRKGFYFREKALAPTNAAILELSRDLHLRQIKKFAFRESMTVDEFEKFCRLVDIVTESFRSGKFIEDYFRTHSIRGIWVNEIDFGRSAMIGAMDADQDEETDELDKEDRQKLDIARIIEQLDQEKDPERFAELANELEVLAVELVRDGQNDLAWIILAALSDHAELREGRSELLCKQALKNARSIATTEFLIVLLERYTVASEDLRPPLGRVFQQSGTRFIEAAMRLLSRNDALYSYRPILDLVIERGTQMRSTLERYLGESPQPTQAGKQVVDTRQNLIRKVIYILGEIRNRKSVEAIRPHIEDNELRIRKETVRALSKIRGTDASRTLISGLSRKHDPELQTAIIQSLGEMKDLTAVPSLINIVRKYSRWGESSPISEQAILSLGKIGSKESLPILIKALGRRTLWDKEENLKLRIAAAGALACIGGENAVRFLNKNAKGADELLAQACEQALEILEKRDIAEPGSSE